MTTADLETNATTKIGELVPEDLDGVTKDQTFREATAALLAGEISVPEWEWFAQRQINRVVDLPYISEATEEGLFQQAFEAIGAALKGLLLTTAETEFRAATLDLLQGKATTQEWLDAAAAVLDALVDVPYLPRVGEEMIFDRGLELIAKALHGLLTGGSANAE
jgi:hypothetical protein